MKAWLDHFAIAATTLAEGTAHTEEALGVKLSPGGQHAAMGTHNRLLSLGPEIYLEVIAIDPEATPPGRPRWFDLDRFTGPPRVTNWVAATDALTAALAAAPDGSGTPMALERADLRWRMAVPDDGCLPFEGAFPALIEWQGTAHPAPRLPDAGCRLKALQITHPDANALRAALTQLADFPAVEIAQGPTKSITALIDTPRGTRSL